MSLTEDRDIKAAKTLLLAGQYEMRVSTHSERMGTLAEPGSGFEVSYENWKQTRVKPEAATL